MDGLAIAQRVVGKVDPVNKFTGDTGRTAKNVTTLIVVELGDTEDRRGYPRPLKLQPDQRYRN